MRLKRFAIREIQTPTQLNQVTWKDFEVILI
jgi:hypothetical protein